MRQTKSVNLTLFFGDRRYIISMCRKSKQRIYLIILSSYIFLENKGVDLQFGTDYALISLKKLRRR